MVSVLLALSYARQFWRALVVIALLTGLTSLLSALQPWPIKLMIDTVLGDTSVPHYVDLFFSQMGLKPSKAAVLMLVVSGTLILFFLQSGCEAITTLAWTLVGRGMVYRLAHDIFAQLQRRSLAYHSRTAPGDTMMQINEDSWSVYKLFDAAVFRPLHVTLSTALMITLMLQLDAFLTAVTVLTAPMVIAASTVAGRSLRVAAEVQRSVDADLRSHVQRTLMGIPVVQAFSQEAREQIRFAGFAAAALKARQRGALFGAVNNLGSGLAVTLGHAFVLWISAQQVLEGRITLGTMLVFLAYSASLQDQIRAVSGIYPVLQSLAPSMRRVHEVLRTPAEVRDRPGARPLPPVQGRIEFDRVFFAYGQDRPVLRDISIAVEPGQTIAVAGPTGAGKSTLVALIPRFFDPTAGRVLIDGHDLRDVQLASLRRQVALVLQEPFLFPLTVAENIAYGRPDASLESIERAARAANAHDFITRLPQGYQTVLGERGANLSGGERQRLSIARALLKDAPILILDEPTSALDAATEALILEAMQNLMQGRTTFIIAHRLATIRHAGRIIVMRGGTIAETGTHEQLVKSNGLYARSYALQFRRSEALGDVR